jgi:hypothetical protein
MILKVKNIDQATGFLKFNRSMLIISRDIPESSCFFDLLLKRDFEAYGIVCCDQPESHVNSLLQKPLCPDASQQRSILVRLDRKNSEKINSTEAY